MVFEDVARKTKYMVYTRKYDTVCRIGDIVDAETIKRLDTHFEFYGHEDAAKVTKGLEGIEGLGEQHGLTVTFLVDLSGSMKGRPVAEACYGVLASAIALEKQGASVEVLGYTTSGQNRPSEDFSGDRTMSHPGRLSEILHVIAKESGVPAERSAGAILAMGTKGLNYENLDGEALIWAAQRLASREADRRLLVLVTDGFEPGCAASERYAEDRAFMKNHLKAVVEEIDEGGEIELAPVIVTWDPYALDKQDTYRTVTGAQTDTADIVGAIGDAIGQAFAPSQKPATASLPVI